MMETELLNHCKEVIKLLKSEYPNQIHYNGIVRKVFLIMEDAIRKIENNKLEEIRLDYKSLVREFVDETTHFNSPVLMKLKRINDLLEK